MAKKNVLYDSIQKQEERLNANSEKNLNNAKMLFNFNKPQRFTKEQAEAFREANANGGNFATISDFLNSGKAEDTINNTETQNTTDEQIIAGPADENTHKEISVVEKGESVEDTILEQAKIKHNDPVKIPLEKLSKSPKNVFSKLEDELFNELKSSIKSNGLLVPIIVRPRNCIETYTIEGEYEILAGHNRFFAFQELGLTEIPAVIIECDDVGAIKTINDTNIQRDKVPELEKCWAYRTLFEQMNRKGSNQYTVEFDDEEQCDTKSQSKIDNRTTEKIGADYGLSSRTIERKIRLTYLNKGFYRMYQRKDITQDMAIELSYISKKVQDCIMADMKDFNLYFTTQNCKDLRKEYQIFEKEKDTKEFARNRYLAILERNNASASDNAKTDGNVKIPVKRYVVDDVLFPKEVKKKDREDYITKALQYIRDNKINLMEAEHE